MSRIGKLPVIIPDGVSCEVVGQRVTAKGKLSQLCLDVCDEINIVLEGKSLRLQPKGSSVVGKRMWGTSRTLLSNLLKGVSEGFTINLEIEGVGYRAQVQGSELVLQLGYTHDVRFTVPNGVTVKADKPTSISIHGPDKRVVGQLAAEIRAVRSPEPYKGKGVRYQGEVILRKEGKKK
ncbi:MAG: 50S ribosomal protein L6 [Alphaproteobacteria bacterium]